MILIIGAGDVGSNIASDLSETHDVTVVDKSADKVDTLSAELDVSGVAGDGRSVAVLEEAGINHADIVIASTDSDAANIMTANAANRSGDPHTIARVKNVGLFETWESIDGDLGVDTMLCIDVLAAEAVGRTIALPGALAVDTFADGLVEVAEFEIGDDTPVTGQSIQEADRYASLTFAAILRGEDVFIPDGETVIESGDRLVVIGSLNGVSRFAEDISSHPTLTAEDSIEIVGGDALGYQIAEQFEARGWSPHVVERDPERATQLKSRLGGSSVAEADIMEIGGFNPDYLLNADLVVGTVDDDTNYVLTQLAREFGVERTAAIVDDPAIVELFEETGLDVVVHPQEIISGEILRAVYGPGPEDVGVFDHDKAEVLELVVDTESVLTGSALGSAANKLPAGVVVGAIIRQGTLHPPRGNTIIQSGDRVIVFADAEVAEDVSDLV